MKIFLKMCTPISRKKMSNEGTLNNYVKILANAFELPGCTPMDYAIGIPETTNQEQEGPPSHDLMQLPLDWLLNQQEINVFKRIIRKKRRLHSVFNKGVAKKIRLEPSYWHVMIMVEKQGQCIRCTVTNSTHWPKYECKTCGVCSFLPFAKGWCPFIIMH
mmetsp:Transcript_20113/g.30585  ORF Transcript_20113/g.30585 Transcript_20113/m.30585 type:complete len:160 (-) Transcript_20113:144-623(-)